MGFSFPTHSLQPHHPAQEDAIAQHPMPRIYTRPECPQTRTTLQARNHPLQHSLSTIGSGRTNVPPTARRAGA